ncbi:MAG: hypothetical protein CMJ47_00725, partial [Planctomyces sp.]|nr:hypothetical protein [Planctomyces sp.]
GRAFNDVVPIFRKLAATLAAIHAEGTAHRDIKPDNIVIVDHEPFLSDFGLVQFDEKNPNTSESEILGPLFFVAPEMMNSEGECDPRSGDVYSLAKSFWVAATGQRFPLPGEQRLGVQALSLSAYVKAPRANLLDKLLDRCTRHRQDERPSANEFSEELKAWCATKEAPIASVDAVAEIALSSNALVARIRNEFDAQEQMKLWGGQLMDAASSELAPLVHALSKFDFTDSKGRPLPARLIEGENNLLWDQWTYPSVLVDDSKGVIWSGVSGTIAQFVQLVQPKDPSTLLISGVRILVHKDERATFCGAHVCVQGSKCDVLWRCDKEAVVGTAGAHEVLQSLISELLSVSPKATQHFLTMIEGTAVGRTSASQ